MKHLSESKLNVAIRKVSCIFTSSSVNEAEVYLNSNFIITCVTGNNMHKVSLFKKGDF